MIANRLIRKVSGLEFRTLGCSLKAFLVATQNVPGSWYGEMHRFIPAWLATVTSPGRMVRKPVAPRAPPGRIQVRHLAHLLRHRRPAIDAPSLRAGHPARHFFGGWA